MIFADQEPNRCPRCGSDNIDGPEFIEGTTENEDESRYSCLNCDAIIEISDDP